MDPIRRRYYRILLLCMILLCALSIGLSLWAIKSAERIQAGQTYSQIFAIKKNHLKDTVLNVIRDIDRLRLLYRSGAAADIDHIASDLNRLYTLSPGQFEGLAVELLKGEEYGADLNILFEDTAPSRVLFSAGITVFSFDHRFGRLRLRLGVNEKQVDALTKADVAAIIHSQVFAQGEYIWVNEIVNWEGGDNYAIRRIHPNLITTEGSFLSTKTTDIKGNTPYLTELEGVKNSGEVYFTYFFKRKDNDTIAEKLTYATLYKDYNWIIAMGVYLDDVQVYIDSARKASDIFTARVIAIASSLFVMLFLIGLWVLTRLERWYLARSSKALREESNLDPLTGALNRRLGDSYIQESFKRYHRGMENPVFFSFDLDDFKKVNDTWGHDAGDAVLRTIVDHIRETMRSTDRLFRWGGEEFLLMYFGVDREGALLLAEKLNKAVAETPIAIGDVSIGITISIGIGWFEKSDVTPEEALKRADLALYQAKSEGKNCARIFSRP